MPEPKKGHPASDCPNVFPQTTHENGRALLLYPIFMLASATAPCVALSPASMQSSAATERESWSSTHGWVAAEYHEAVSEGGHAPPK